MRANQNKNTKDSKKDEKHSVESDGKKEKLYTILNQHEESKSKPKTSLNDM